VLLAGTIAEEIVYRDISTGAQNDLERATEIARSMVMDYGMSRLGRVNYRESPGSPFLATGKGDDRVRTHSEHTAREIDEEIHRILDENLERVRHILDVRRESLVALAERLIEVESISSDELQRIIEATSPGPLVVPGTDEKLPRPPESESASEEPKKEKRG
jgi:cell division protease FtsH